MKKLAAVVLAAAVALSAAGCSKEDENGPYTVNDTVEWTVTSSPGGGSDVFSRMIADIMISEDMVNGEAVVITNKTDGNGEIGRHEIAHLKGPKVNRSLITFNSGDLMPMVQITKNRSENFRMLAIMAVDKQLLFKGTATKYTDFAEAIEAAKNGTRIVIGGSKGDDVATYNALIEELGISRDLMTFITYSSSSDAITAALGGHVEFVISKPASASEYVTAGSLIPVLALANQRYGGNLSEAPTLSEIGDYNNVEVPVWRGVAASENMSDSAVEYWSDILKRVSETEKWKTEYLDKYMLIGDFKGAQEATEYVAQYEADYLESIEKSE